MEYEEIKKKLNDINTEDYIWFIYIGIIILSWYANSLERKYYIYNDKISKEKYRRVMIFIFSILTVIYIYFLKNSIEDKISLKEDDKEIKKELVNLSLLASLLITISGFIFLYITIKDDNLDIELAFN